MLFVLFSPDDSGQSPCFCQTTKAKGSVLVPATRQWELELWAQQILFGRTGGGHHHVASVLQLEALVPRYREPDAFLSFVLPGTTMGQVLSLPMVLIGLAATFWALRRKA